MDALTPKQESFSQAIVSGLSQAAAYRSAYAADNMCPEAIWVEASRLAANPLVTLRIAQLTDAVAKASITAAAWTLDRQVEESAVNLTGARKDSQWAAANGALANIGNLTGALKGTQAGPEIRITKVTVVLKEPEGLPEVIDPVPSLPESL